jgi:hypothetical protein
VDLYDNVEDIVVSEQTIIYAVHDDANHLEIFFSGDVTRREHSKFASNIEFIDCLPPGLYEAVFEKLSDETASEELVRGSHTLRFEWRTLDDIRALGVNSENDDYCFSAVARLSEITNGFYRTFAQPVVRSMTTDQGAEWMRRLNPLRLEYEVFSDRNPMMRSLTPINEWAIENRMPVGYNNFFLKWQGYISDQITQSLNTFYDWRNLLTEQLFFGIYSQPWLQALLGIRASDGPPRINPGKEPGHQTLIEHRKEALMAEFHKGGAWEALLRGLVYIKLTEGSADEREFKMICRIADKHDPDMTLAKFKEIFRKQYFMILLDNRQALQAIPTLLVDYPDQGPELYELIREVATAGGRLGREAEERLIEIKPLFFPNIINQKNS